VYLVNLLGVIGDLIQTGALGRGEGGSRHTFKVPGVRKVSTSELSHDNTNRVIIEAKIQDGW
jgi:hypothetical protein